MNDYIKREDALNCVSGHFFMGIHKAIQSIPGADVVERKTGEWRGEHKMPDMPRYEFYKCSECGFLSQSVVNYCPRCGADMRGKEQ